MRLAVLFLGLFLMQCSHTRAPDNMNSSGPTSQEQRSAAMKTCADADKIWDPAKSLCVDRKAYCLQLKDGSVWQDKTKRCLSQLAQCQMRADGSTWLNNKCMSAEDACTYNKQTWLNNKCLSTLESCQNKGKYWTLNAQSACVIKTFDDICQNRSTDKEADNTLSALQKISNTSSCIELSQWLNNQTSISLRSQDGSINITDVGPFIGLTKLVELNLDNNSVTDLTPLANLSSLEVLNLENNRNVTDLFPIAALTNLHELDLGNNSVEDLTPLTKLTNLRILDLWQNHVSDISSLAGLTNLVELQLKNNSISDVTPLKGLMGLKALSLDFNPVEDNKTVDKCPTDYSAPTLLREFCSAK